MRLYPLLYSYPIGVNAPILYKKLKIEFNCSDYAQDNGWVLQCRVRKVLVFA